MHPKIRDKEKRSERKYMNNPQRFFCLLGATIVLLAMLSGGCIGRGAQVEIEYNGYWSGSVGSTSSSKSVEGYGDRTYTIEEGGIVSAVIQKQEDSSNTLTVTIYDDDGNVVSRDSTSASYGVVTVSGDVDSSGGGGMIYFGLIIFFISFGIGLYVLMNQQKTGPSPYHSLNKNQLMEECKKRGIEVNWWTANNMTYITALQKDDMKREKQRPQEPPPHQRTESIPAPREKPEEVGECPACGTIVPSTAKFCLECGKNLK